MIITRAPFRLSFGGGGSDLPVYYRRFGGCVVSASINKYMYIDVHPFFEPDRIQLKYSKTENVGSHDEIQHRIFRTVLQRFGLYGVEFSSMADFPAGTGLGSSSSFTVALLQSVYAYLREFRSKTEIAAEACRIEIDELGSPIGKQDQYAAACGGLNFIRFRQDDSVVVEPVVLSKDGIDELCGRLMLFYTGVIRDANRVLESEVGLLRDDDATIGTMHRMVSIACEMRGSLESRRLDDFGALLHESWMQKRSIAAGVTNGGIDEVYRAARDAGATGGKLLGAGGGGFILFYAPPERHAAVERALAGLRRFPFRIESGGVQVILYEG